MNKINISKGQIEIAKIDEESRLVKGIVYKPEEADAHGDWMTREEIRKAAYNFMKEARTGQIDTKHDCEKVDAYVCESYIAKVDDPEGYIDGSWVIVVKIEDDDVWQDVLDGNYGGFSMYGSGYRDEGSKAPNS